MKYLGWAGAADAGFFKYYDSEEKVNKTFELKEMSVDQVEYTVRGFDEKTNSPIYSNDITSFVDEEFSVKSEGGTLFEGRYVKDDILALGAKLHIKLSGTSGGEEVSLYLKGNNYFKVSTLIGKGGDVDITKDAIKFTGFTDEKAGAVKYRAPVFVKGGAREEAVLTEDDTKDIF